MESLQYIKSRRMSVKNIGKITKAMEVVAATKMRKSQQIALSTRPYAFKVLELLEKLGRFAPLETVLTQKRPINKTLVVIVASDRGLAGSFNTQVFKKAEPFLSADNIFVAVGKKSEKFILKKNLPLAGKFYGFGDFIKPGEIEPLSELIIQGFVQKKWDIAITVSMHFRTALKQEPYVRHLLPVDFEKIREVVREIVPEHGKYSDNQIKNGELKFTNGLGQHIDYLFEPSAEQVLETLIPYLVRMQIYHLVLEANASEHSARRVAMKNASDNAQEIFEAFTLQYNKARQAGITKEMVEITATQSALT